jgi:hypothetical protein
VRVAVGEGGGQTHSICWVVGVWQGVCVARQVMEGRGQG